MSKNSKPASSQKSQERSKSQGNMASEKPILQFSVLCDGLATPQETGNKPVFIGVFSSLRQPAVIPQFFIVNRWINGTGTHKQSIKILNPALKEIAAPDAQEFNLPSKVVCADLVNGFINVSLEIPGVYWVEIELDGKLVMAYPLPVFDDKTSIKLQ